MIGLDFIILQNLSQNHSAAVCIILKWFITYRPNIMTPVFSKILGKKKKSERNIQIKHKNVKDLKVQN